MQPTELLFEFYSAFLASDKEKAQKLTDHTYDYFGWDFEKHWGILSKERQLGRFSSKDIAIKSFGEFHQILINGSLLEEQQFKFVNGLLAGSNSIFDSFGKLVFNNYVPERVLNIRPKKGDGLQSIGINGVQSKDFAFHEQDGFYSIPFVLNGDDMKTKEMSITIKTNRGEYQQVVLLRGIDHPANIYKHIRLAGNGKSIKLNNDPLRIHRLEVEHADGKEIFQHPETQLLSFSGFIKKVFVMSEGAAFNYYYHFE